VCGIIAARARERGVWVAPANVPLQGVLALDPPFSPDDWAELFGLQFNLIRWEGHDFRPMSAHTLSDERTLLPVSVRRLMIQLRKVALRRGLDFVFESNDERLRDSVRLALEEMLGFMFERGAFAGATPQQAFRVVTDADFTTPESIATEAERGRFIVQIQVAPSQPAEFITVLLTRTGEGQLQATEG
jgi:phage tail sheath protein FI